MLMTLKLCVFARALSGQPSGRGFLAREMVAAMLRSPGAPQIDLFCAEDVGIPGVRFHPARGEGALSDAWRVFFTIASDVRELRPDVFWGTTHFLPRGLRRKLPKVVTLLDLVWRDHPETMSRRFGVARWLERGLWEADRIHCISEFTRERLRVHFPELVTRAEVVHLAPNPRLASVGTDGALLKRKHGIDGPFILNVDTFEPRKNLRLVLDVMSRRPEIQFVQCGHRGWNVEADWSLAKRLPNVRLLEYVDEESLAALYRGAQACVFPTLYEGFHLSPLDALALGTPVVASDIPVHREILANAALYFSPLDDLQLEARIDEVVADAPSRERLAQLGRAQAASFSWDEAATKMTNLFQGSLESPRGIEKRAGPMRRP
jgi:glycosyltransferase involved in cell wall biosynthesis